MPFLAAIPAFLAANASWLAPAAGLAAAGTTIGSTIAQDVSQPGQPSGPPQPTAAQNVAAETAKRQQEGALVAQQDPNIVANTNGSLTGLSDQTFASSAAGLPGTFGQGGIDLSKILSFLGGSGGGNPTDLMALAANGSGSITG